MELMDKYKDGETFITIKGMKVNIVNDPSQFKLYKNLGLPVFKKKRKKNVDTLNDGTGE